MSIKPIKFTITFALLLAGIISLRASQSPQSLANQIEASIENGNSVFINQKFNFDTFSEIALASKKNLPKEEVTNMRKLATLIDAGTIIQNQVNKTASYRCVNIDKSSGYVKLIFRVHSNIGLNYHEYTVDYSNDMYSIVDIYTYYNDFLLSRDFYKLFKADYNQDFEKKLATLYHSKKHNKTINLFNQNIDKDNSSGLYYALRSSSYCDIEYMNELINLFDTEVSHRGTNLFILEGLFKQQAYTEILKHINILEISVGKDPYLNYLRASVYRAQNKLNRAEWLLNKAIRELPEEQTMYFSLLELYLDNNNFEGASMLLQQLVDNFNFYKDDLQPLLASYPSYLNSDEYLNWHLQ